MPELCREWPEASEPKPCDYCGRVGTHTTICWAIAPTKHAGRIGVAQGSTNGIPDPYATDRAEDNMENARIGEGPVGQW